MNIEQIQYVVEVAKTKSITTASNNLHVTQSAISQAISNLESELKIKLFTRSRHGAIPTSEGQNIILKMLDVVSKLDEIKEEANSQIDVIVGELSIASIPIGMDILINTVSKFKKDYPNVQFQISEKGSGDILNDISAKKVDIGLIGLNNDLLKKNSGLIFTKIFEGRIVVFVGKNSPLSSFKKVSAKELLKYPFVLYNEDYVHEFVNHFNHSIGKIDVWFKTNNTRALVRALKNDLAISAGYDLSFLGLTNDENHDLAILEIEDFVQESKTVGWIQTENKSNSLITKEFIKRYLNEFSERYS
ncbi:LysR family transcriptional regulator [Gottfriedia acidiceleris]|uniref:LysR family transcriptional regulator n=1 Tax=Gottfriedia acidiceleris TaxID=371036 RepID=A0ABY4JPT4_9BACI|nr:LysR family transcriptional regulator [Gottfriedia acidiceleris]UPM55446.1 LysR family transcriptional regulator [Gottfriedia acidiceleris]